MCLESLRKITKSPITKLICFFSIIYISKYSLLHCIAAGFFFCVLMEYMEGAGRTSRIMTFITRSERKNEHVVHDEHVPATHDVSDDESDDESDVQSTASVSNDMMMSAEPGYEQQSISAPPSDGLDAFDPSNSDEHASLTEGFETLRSDAYSSTTLADVDTYARASAEQVAKLSLYPDETSSLTYDSVSFTDANSVDKSQIPATPKSSTNLETDGRSGISAHIDTDVFDGVESVDQYAPFPQVA